VYNHSMNNCPMCEGEPTILGVLGRITWLRCRNCGWDYAADEPEDVFYSRGEVEASEHEE
jgi:hypothetical protein